jgi:hypothetical protein
MSRNLMRKDLGIDEIILKFQKNIGREGVGWIHLTQKLVKWWAIANMAIKLWVSQRRGGHLQLSNCSVTQQ